MATSVECEHNVPSRRECHSFTLLLSGFEEITPEIENGLFDAGCNDATLGISAGTPYLAFDREAETLEEAIKSAIMAVEGCGLGIEVVRVIPPGAETIEVVNAYLKLRRQLMSHLPKDFVARFGDRVDEVLKGLVESNPDVLKHAFSADSSAPS